MTTDTTPTIKIPADVRDNSQTVTDYVYMGRRRPDKGVVTPQQRDAAIMWSDRHGYVRYQEYDTNPDGQRCRFDILLNVAGGMVHFFHTEYFTRVDCAAGEWCHSYATHYVLTTYASGEPDDGPSPLCDEHRRRIERAYGDSVTLTLSERLRIGQHDDGERAR